MRSGFIGLSYIGLVSLFIMYISVPADAEWQDIIELEGTSTGQDVVAINRDDTICLAWTDVDVEASLITLKSRFWNNGEWGPATIIKSPFLGMGSPALATGPDGEFYLTYQSATGMMFTWFHPDTGWTEPDPMGATGYSEVLTCDPAGVLYLVYRNHGSDDDLCCKIFDGTWWTPSFVIFEYGDIWMISASPSPYGGINVTGTLYGGNFMVGFVNADRTFHTNIVGDPAIYGVCMTTDSLNRGHLLYDAYEESYPAHYATLLPGNPPVILPGISLTGEVPYTFERDDRLHITSDPYLGAHIAWMRQYQISPCLGSVFTRTVSPFYEEPAVWIPSSENVYPENILCDSRGTVHLFYHDTVNDNFKNLSHGKKYRTRPGALVDLNKTLFNSGDAFQLTVELSNPIPETLAAEWVLCVQAGNEIFWYPGWSEQMERTPVTLNPGQTVSISIMEFTVASLEQRSGPFHIFAAMLDPDSGELVGDPSGTGFTFQP